MTDFHIQVTEQAASLEEQWCVVCDDRIDGDVMIPEGEGPMHPDCWVKWVEQK